MRYCDHCSYVSIRDHTLCPECERPTRPITELETLELEDIFNEYDESVDGPWTPPEPDAMSEMRYPPS